MLTKQCLFGEYLSYGISITFPLALPEENRTYIYGAVWKTMFAYGLL